MYLVSLTWNYLRGFRVSGLTITIVGGFHGVYLVLFEIGLSYRVQGKYCSVMVHPIMSLLHSLIG